MIVKCWDFENLGWMNMPVTVKGCCEMTAAGCHDHREPRSDEHASDC